MRKTCRKISKWVLLTVHQQHTLSCFMAAINVNALCGGDAVYMCHDYRCRRTNLFGPFHHSPRLVSLTVFRCQQQLHSAVGSQNATEAGDFVPLVRHELSRVHRFQVAPDSGATILGGLCKPCS